MRDRIGEMLTAAYIYMYLACSVFIITLLIRPISESEEGSREAEGAIGVHVHRLNDRME